MVWRFKKTAIPVLFSGDYVKSDVEQVLGGTLATIDSSNPVPANVVQINNSATSAAFLNYLMSGGMTATVDSATFTPTTTAFEVSGLSDADDDTYKHQCVKFGNATGTALDGKSFFVTASQGTSANPNGKVKLTVETMPIAPSNGDAFVVFGRVAA